MAHQQIRTVRKAFIDLSVIHLEGITYAGFCVLLTSSDTAQAVGRFFFGLVGKIYLQFRCCSCHLEVTLLVAAIGSF